MAARLVIGVTLAVITATAKVAVAAAVGAMLLPVAVKARRSVVAYVDREFIQQWRLALALLPFGVSCYAGANRGPPSQ